MTHTTPTLHEVLARGIDKGLRDVGGELSGCTPATQHARRVVHPRTRRQAPQASREDRTVTNEILTPSTHQFRRLSADRKLVIVEQTPDGPGHIRMTVVDHAVGAPTSTSVEVNLIAWTDVLNWLGDLRRNAR